MHHEDEHSPEENGFTFNRPLRPYTPPRQWSAISRRTFLRGTGVLMALPFLDSLPSLAAEPAASPDAPGGTPRRYPQRLAAGFMGTGINRNHWLGKGAGADVVLSK